MSYWINCCNSLIAISLLSVETTTLEIFFELNACSIVHAIKGLPPIILMFFLGISLEPFLAGIMAM